MAQFFEVHPDNPQARFLRQAAQILDKGGIAAIPTDSSYALVCHLDDKAAAENLRRIRGVDEKHHLTLLCRDLSELASYARVDNRQYRLLKSATPGPFTFILEATKEVPRRVSHPSRRTIGLRVPDHRVTQDLLAIFGDGRHTAADFLFGSALRDGALPPRFAEIGQILDKVVETFAIAVTGTFLAAVLSVRTEAVVIAAMSVVSMAAAWAVFRAALSLEVSAPIWLDVRAAT